MQHGIPEPSAVASLLVQSDLIALALADGDCLLFANATFARLFGCAGTVAGRRLSDLTAPAHRGAVAGLLSAAHRAPASCVVEVARQAGHPLQVELRARDCIAGGNAFCAIFAQDVTDRSRSAQRLNLLAYSDPLTGLANRALFADRLAEAAVEARRDGRGFGLIMLDLDRFKPVNDAYGHAGGDLVLQCVAARLQSSLRAGETIARLGGDEFAILLRGLMREQAATRVAERVLAAIREPMRMDDGIMVTVDASAGLAMFPAHGDTVEQLVVAADLALYTAKSAGRGRLAWAGPPASGTLVDAAVPWTETHELGIPAMDAQHARLAALLGELAAALRNGQDPKPAFRAFISYAALHFGEEERMMAQRRYRGAVEHAEQHRRLLADIADMRLDGEGFSASLVLRYLQEWLFRHIDGADREMALAIGAGSAAPLIHEDSELAASQP